MLRNVPERIERLLAITHLNRVLSMEAGALTATNASRAGLQADVVAVDRLIIRRRLGG